MLLWHIVLIVFFFILSITDEELVVDVSVICIILHILLLIAFLRTDMFVYEW